MDGSSFEALGKPSDAVAAAEAAASSCTATGAPVGGGPALRAPPDCSRLECFQCGEEVQMRWDDEAEEWMLLDAVYATDGSGRICHASCAT